MHGQPAPPPPFSCNYTPQLSELLSQLGCSIGITTYQAGKLIFLSPNKTGDNIHLLPRTFDKPMGVAIEENRMAIATRNEILVLENSPELAQHYPGKTDTYDALWLPRITFHTGHVDMHDIAFGESGIYAINTSFSCLCTVDGNFNFKPIWKPNFIDQLVSEDRCHLNGLVIRDGKPKYVTALGQTNTPQGWRENITKGGLLIDVETDEILLEGLAMPHSPRMHGDKLYFLQSAAGELNEFQPETGELRTVKKFDGFCRGLAIYGDYAFVGFSKLRKNSSTFSHLTFSDRADFAGICIVHLPTGSVVGDIRFQNSVDEIYEVIVLPNSIRPNILNTRSETHTQSLAVPGSTFWAINQ